MISSTVVLLLLVLLVMAGVGGLLALRYRLAFRIAVRNVRRGRVRTILLVLGLLIGTTIISGSLVINDTVTAVNQHFVLQNWGYVDEGIYNESPDGGLQPFPLQVFTDLNTTLSGHPLVAGITPEIITVGQAYDQATGIPQTNLDLVGVNGNQSGALGPFHPVGGGALAGPGPGQVLLDEQAASQLNASAGDHVLLYGRTGAPVPATVQAVVTDDARGGFFFLFAGQAGNLFVPLATAQQLEGLPSSVINFIAVTNPGSQLQGAADSENTSRLLNATLPTIGAPPSLTVHQLLRQGLDSAARSGQQTATIFLVFGLFSIAAGGMLVVGIFVMLAEERMGEMGTVRAIGLRRRQLVLVFFFEGLVYAAGSALAGVIAGVGVGYALTWAFSRLFAAGGITGEAILASFTVSPSSLLIAYVAGFLLTVVTVAFASWRASRLNIVRAIRSIPEPPPTLRTYTRLAYLGVPILAFGGYLFATTFQGTADVSLPSLGGDLVVLGAALIGSRFLKNRVIFTAAAVALLVWNGYEPLRHAVLGTAHTGSIFVVFTLGIFLVLGAVLIFVFDSDFLVTGATRLFDRRPRAAAVVRVGLSYPSRRPVRPALTLTIFTLVVFTVVVVAVFTNSLETNLRDSIEAQTGGYSFYGVTTVAVPDLAQEIRANATLSSLISAVVPLVSGAAALSSPGWGAEAAGWTDAVHAAPEGLPGASDFYGGNSFSFAATDNGSSATATWAALAATPDAAIVDGSYGAAGLIASGTRPHLFVGSALTVSNPVTGNASTLRVIGVLTGQLLGGVWLNPGTATTLGFTSISSALLSVASGASDVRASQSLKTAFFPQGLVLFDFSQILATTIQTFQSTIALLEMFVALGLAVGIAAMGIVALRAVVERRREIGMLRAGGFRRAHIFLAFFLEYSYISLLGIFAGALLGILLAYEAAATPANGLTFSIPWGTVALVVAVAYGLTILAILGPSYRAARLPPSEAVRYTE